MKNKRTAIGITIPVLMLYYKAIIIKPALYQDSNKQVDQWNRIKGPEINPHNYGHLHFDKSVKPKQWKEENILQQMLLV